MEKICPYCGRTLAEGESCTCPQSVLLEHQKKKGETEGNMPRPEPEERPIAPQIDPEAMEQQAKEEEPSPSQPDEPREENTTQAPPPPPGVDPAFSQPAPAPRYPSRLTLAFENFIPFFKAYFHAPAQTVETACRHHDLPLGVLYLILPLVSFAAFFVLGLCQGLRELAYYLNQLSSMLSMANTGGQITLDLPRAILGGVLLPLGVMVVFTLGLFLLGKAVKGAMDLQSAFLTVVFSAILPSILLIIAIPLLYVSLWASAALAMLAFLSWILLMFHTVHHLCTPAQGGRFCWSSLLFFALSLGVSAVLCGFILEFALEAVSITSPLFNQFMSPSGYRTYGW